MDEGAKMDDSAIQDMINRAVVANTSGAPVSLDPLVLTEEGVGPEFGGGYSGYDYSSADPDKVSLNIGCKGSVKGKLQIYDFDNNKSVLGSTEYYLACLLDFVESPHRGEFELLARDSKGKLKYLNVGTLEVPNYDEVSIDYEKWDASVSARGCGCYFELRGFGCLSTWTSGFVEVIEDDHYLCGRTIDVLCRIRENDSKVPARLEYLSIDKQISGGGGSGTETWASGRFSLDKRVAEDGSTTFSTQNTYYYVGGSIKHVASAVMVNGINYLKIDMNTGAASYGHATSEGELVVEAACLSVYVMPLYTILDSSVSLDWRIGPAAIMGEM